MHPQSNCGGAREILQDEHGVVDLARTEHYLVMATSRLLSNGSVECTRTRCDRGESGLRYVLIAQILFLSSVAFGGDRSMSTSGTISVAAISIVFYICGGLCIFKTKMLVAWGQRSYAKSRFIQGNPLSSMVTKSWYPVYIRCGGIFIRLWALTIDYLVLFRGFH
jgi:hypothetical protein